MTADEIKTRIGPDHFALLLEDLGAKHVNRQTRRSTCPAHNGDNPEALHYDQQGDAVVWKCFTASHGGTAIDLVMEARGIDFGPAVDWIAENHFGERRSEPPPKPKPARTETARKRYEIRNVWDALIATHIRIEFSEGTKKFLWERDGTNGLKGLKAADLPLYNSEKVEAAGPELALFVSEGEKAADALTDHGLLALGTVCGADTTPSHAVLGLLACRDVHLWPDNDDAGQRHMEALAKIIRPIVASLHWIKWNEVPKGDAADFFKTHTTEDLEPLAFDDEQAAEPPRTPKPGAKKGRLVFSDPHAAMEGVKFIWAGRVARGKFSTVEGDGGLGKSSLVLDFAARGSRGDPPYDGAETSGRMEPFRSIIISAEDAWLDTIKPRLVAARADLAHIFHVAGIRGEQEELDAFDLARDLASLEASIVEKAVAVVAFDPLSAFLGKIDANSDTDVRSKLSPLTAMLSRTDCAGIGIRHHSKASGVRAKNRGLHSVAFSNAARIVLTVGEHPTEAQTFALAWAKSNLGPKVPTLLYRLAPEDLGTDAKGNRIIPVRVEWAGVSDLSADDLTAQDEQETRGKIDDARDFLAVTVADEVGVEGRWLEGEAKKAGISYRTLRRAKKAMGIKSRPNGFGGPVLWFPAPKKGGA